jgi:hypothetical protein
MQENYFNRRAMSSSDHSRAKRPTLVAADAIAFGASRA